MPFVHGRSTDLPVLDTFGSDIRHIYWQSLLGAHVQPRGEDTEFATLKDDFPQMDHQAVQYVSPSLFITISFLC